MHPLPIGPLYISPCQRCPWSTVSTRQHCPRARLAKRKLPAARPELHACCTARASRPTHDSACMCRCRGFSVNAAGEPVPGDLVVAVGGERVQSSEDIAAIVEQFSVGDQVPVTLLRGRKEVAVNVPLVELPDAVG